MAVRPIIINVCLCLAFLSNSAFAIVITGYDIDSTYVSGTGSWEHTYTGTVTTVSDDIANYSGGSGTLNDGVIGTSVNETQLFSFLSDSDPRITLFLDGFYTISEIYIHGGDFANNIPGTITGVDVSINSLQQSYATSSVGPVFRNQVDDLVTITGTSLATQLTDRIVLSGFGVNSQFDGPAFSITEIVVNGSPFSVPEPSILSLVGLGLAGIGLALQKKVMQL